jgi:hypothetical protein
MAATFKLSTTRSWYRWGRSVKSLRLLLITLTVVKAEYRCE